MPDITWQARDYLGRLVEVTGETEEGSTAVRVSPQELEAGGGVQTVRLLTPFPVTFATAGLATGVVAGVVPAGSLLIKAFLATSTFWEKAGGLNPDSINLSLIQQGGSGFTVVEYDPENQTAGDAGVHPEGGILDPASGGIRSSAEVIADRNLVLTIAGPVVQGAGTVYALIAEPAA